MTRTTRRQGAPGVEGVPGGGGGEGRRGQKGRSLANSRREASDRCRPRDPVTLSDGDSGAGGGRPAAPSRPSSPGRTPSPVAPLTLPPPSTPVVLCPRMVARFQVRDSGSHIRDQNHDAHCGPQCFSSYTKKDTRLRWRSGGRGAGAAPEGRNRLNCVSPPPDDFVPRPTNGGRRMGTVGFTPMLPCLAGPGERVGGTWRWGSRE